MVLPIELLWTLAVIAVATAFLVLPLLWRRAARYASQKKLEFEVYRQQQIDKDCEEMLKQAPLLRYMELDNDFAQKFHPDFRFISLGSYMGSLRASGQVSLQRALVSIVERFGLRVALPLALFAPPAWKRDRFDSLSGALHTAPLAGALLSNGISTLGLLTVSTLSQRANLDLMELATQGAENLTATEDNTKAQLTTPAAGGAGGTSSSSSSNPTSPRRPTALQLMAHGSNPHTDGGISDALAGSTFHVIDDLLRVTTQQQQARNNDKTNIEDDKDNDIADSQDDIDTIPFAPSPTPVHPVFPDLYLGGGGLKLTCSDAQSAVNSILAVVCNRLMANALVGVGIDNPAIPLKPFTVIVPTKTPGETVSVTSVEDFIDALEASGHTVKTYLPSNTTSFGIGMCVKDGDDGIVDEKKKFLQIPLAYPLVTGLFSRDTEGNAIPSTTLMAHASIHVEISGPLLNCHIEWCLSIEGCTGWLAANGISRPWQSNSLNPTLHSEQALSSPQGRRRALRLMTASACVLNAAASQGKLLFGGYGFLGVCIDSVAAVQHALTGTCSLYPLLLGGDAKMGLLASYNWIQKSATRHSSQPWQYNQEAVDLRKAILSLPCDGVVDPRAAGDTARRALATLPAKSVFAATAKCREGLMAAAAAADRLVVQE